VAKRNLVCIEWIDADAEAGWVSERVEHRDAKAAPQVLKTYGLHVRTTKHFEVYASTHDLSNKRWSELSRIPRGMVQKVTVLMEVDE
jgi:hypothetical protein